MKKVLILSLVLAGCGRAVFEPLDYQCKIVDNDIVCPDGSSMPLPKDGKDGSDGNDGADGVDGVNGAPGLIVAYVEPCLNVVITHPEVLLVLSTGEIMAWYKDRGFVILKEGVTYQTTDGKACKFKIVNGSVVSL